MGSVPHPLLEASSNEVEFLTPAQHVGLAQADPEKIRRLLAPLHAVVEDPVREVSLGVVSSSRRQLLEILFDGLERLPGIQPRDIHRLRQSVISLSLIPEGIEFRERIIQVIHGNAPVADEQMIATGQLASYSLFDPERELGLLAHDRDAPVLYPCTTHLGFPDGSKVVINLSSEQSAYLGSVALDAARSARSAVKGLGSPQKTRQERQREFLRLMQPELRRMIAPALQSPRNVDVHGSAKQRQILVEKLAQYPLENIEFDLRFRHRIPIDATVVKQLSRDARFREKIIEHLRAGGDITNFSFGSNEATPVENPAPMIDLSAVGTPEHGAYVLMPEGRGDRREAIPGAVHGVPGDKMNALQRAQLQINAATKTRNWPTVVDLYLRYLTQWPQHVEHKFGVSDTLAKMKSGALRPVKRLISVAGGPHEEARAWYSELLAGRIKPEEFPDIFTLDFLDLMLSRSREAMPAELSALLDGKDIVGRMEDTESVLLQAGQTAQFDLVECSSFDNLTDEDELRTLLCQMIQIVQIGGGLRFAVNKPFSVGLCELLEKYGIRILHRNVFPQLRTEAVASASESVVDRANEKLKSRHLYFFAVKTPAFSPEEFANCFADEIGTVPFYAPGRQSRRTAEASEASPEEYTLALWNMLLQCTEPEDARTYVQALEAAGFLDAFKFRRLFQQFFIDAPNPAMQAVVAEMLRQRPEARDIIEAFAGEAWRTSVGRQTLRILLPMLRGRIRLPVAMRWGELADAYRLYALAAENGDDPSDAELIDLFSSDDQALRLQQAEAFSSACRHAAENALLQTVLLRRVLRSPETDLEGVVPLLERSVESEADHALCCQAIRLLRRLRPDYPSIHERQLEADRALAMRLAEEACAIISSCKANPRSIRESVPELTSEWGRVNLENFRLRTPSNGVFAGFVSNVYEGTEHSGRPQQKHEYVRFALHEGAGALITGPEIWKDVEDPVTLSRLDVVLMSRDDTNAVSMPQSQRRIRLAQVPLPTLLELIGSQKKSGLAKHSERVVLERLQQDPQPQDVRSFLQIVTDDDCCVTAQTLFANQVSADDIIAFLGEMQTHPRVYATLESACIKLLTTSPDLQKVQTYLAHAKWAKGIRSIAALCINLCKEPQKLKEVLEKISEENAEKGLIFYEAIVPPLLTMQMDDVLLMLLEVLPRPQQKKYMEKHLAEVSAVSAENQFNILESNREFRRSLLLRSNSDLRMLDKPLQHVRDTHAQLQGHRERLAVALSPDDAHIGNAMLERYVRAFGKACRYPGYWEQQSGNIYREKRLEEEAWTAFLEERAALRQKVDEQVPIPDGAVSSLDALNPHRWKQGSEVFGVRIKKLEDNAKKLGVEVDDYKLKIEFLQRTDKVLFVCSAFSAAVPEDEFEVFRIMETQSRQKWIYGD
jgi:hypothetical protein